MGRASSTTMQCRCSSSFGPGRQSYSKVAKQVHSFPCESLLFFASLSHSWMQAMSLQLLHPWLYKRREMEKQLQYPWQKMFYRSSEIKVSLWDGWTPLLLLWQQPNEILTGFSWCFLLKSSAEWMWDWSFLPRNPLTSTGKQRAGLTSWETVSTPLQLLTNATKCWQGLSWKIPVVFSKRSLSDLFLLPDFSRFLPGCSNELHVCFVCTKIT